MVRFRIYNSHKEYYSINSRNIEMFSFYPKTIRATKYITKTTQLQSYESSKIILPSKIFPKLSIGSKYLLLKLFRTHLISANQDKWGYSYLLFIKDDTIGASNSLLVPCSKICQKQRKNYSKIHPHKRKSFKKYYTSPKIYANKTLIGKNLQIISVKPAIRLKYFVTEKENFGLYNMKKIIDIGRGHIIFYEDNNAKILDISYKKKRDIPAYRKTMSLIHRGINIQKIAKLQQIRYTTVWGHICEAFKKRDISGIRLKEILLRECDDELRNKMVVYIEKRRDRLYKQDKKLFFHGKKIEHRTILDISLHRLKLEIYRETGKYLPLHMIKAVALLLTWMYKK